MGLKWFLIHCLIYQGDNESILTYSIEDKKIKQKRKFKVCVYIQGHPTCVFKSKYSMKLGDSTYYESAPKEWVNSR